MVGGRSWNCVRGIGENAALDGAQIMDMTTLFFALAMICIVTTAFTWFLHFNSRVVGTFAVACSNSCFTVGFGLIALRAHMSGFLSFIVANSLISIGHILIIYGIQQFIGRRTYPLISFFVFTIYMADYSYWYYIDNNFRALRCFTWVA